MRTQKIYYDPADDAQDGHGWNVVDDDDTGGIASRFSSAPEATAHAKALGFAFYIDEDDVPDMDYVGGEWVTT